MANRFLSYLFIFLALTTTPALAKQITLGPPNPDAEQSWAHWNHGASGDAFQAIDETDPATGMYDFTLGNTNADRASHADWRSDIFGLGPAAAGHEPITFSFSYKLVDTVNPGDNIRVQLRFYDKDNKFLNQKEFLLGTGSGDSEMPAYKKFVTANIRAPVRAQSADVTMSANFYTPDHWTSGTARFDDLSVTTISPFPLFKAIVALTALIIVVGLIIFFARLQKT